MFVWVMILSYKDEIRGKVPLKPCSILSLEPDSQLAYRTPAPCSKETGMVESMGSHWVLAIGRNMLSRRVDSQRPGRG
ncbi:MAG: hypothetical protein BZY88_01515 [SAR202 cluster bacterium Io17-Chloro-G9]|nr:MAG: hypothetical protein BZY88_01515 [SAR202 cluster bacterium Io17-Chloro-G9]